MRSKITTNNIDNWLQMQMLANMESLRSRIGAKTKAALQSEQPTHLTLYKTSTLRN